MKYVIWVLVFVAYLLCVAGLFRLMGRLTAGVELEMQVEREVYGETVIRTQEVPFNEAPVVVMTIGMAGLFIAVGTGFIAADYISRAWVGEEEKKLSKRDKRLKICLFTAFFLAFAFLFRFLSGIVPPAILELIPSLSNWAPTVDYAFGLTGWIFMILTCGLTIIVSALLGKTPGKEREAAEIQSSEVG